MTNLSFDDSRSTTPKRKNARKVVSIAENNKREKAVERHERQYSKGTYRMKVDKSINIYIETRIRIYLSINDG